MSTITEEFIAACPGTTVYEIHGNYGCLRSGDDLQLDKAFKFLEDKKVAGEIMDYSVAQSSLEQIFVEFAQGRASKESEHGNEQDQQIQLPRSPPPPSVSPSQQQREQRSEPETRPQDRDGVDPV